MKDTRNNTAVTEQPNFDEGIRFKYLIRLTEVQKQQLARGMKKSDKGQLQFKAMQELKALLGEEIMKSSSFRLPEEEFNHYMKEGES